MDETSIKVKKIWTYLSRAIDSEGNTLKFLLSPTHDAEAAKHFFLKALHFTGASAPQAHLVEKQVVPPTPAANSATPVPRVINVDKHVAHGLRNEIRLSHDVALSDTSLYLHLLESNKGVTSVGCRESDLRERVARPFLRR